MDLERVRALADLMEEKNLASLELCEGENKIVLARGGVAAAAISAPAQATAAPAAEAAATAPAPAPADTANDENTLTCPLVGCVYLAQSPGAKPFVKVGDRVKKGQVLCIVEAMKVMNEFQSPREGVIAEVCVENGQLAEFGQPLFRLQ